MTTLFVTSAGTDIGKTHVCCRLLDYLAPKFRLRCVKPVVTGFESATQETSDTLRLLRAQILEVDQAAIEATSPWRYRAALSADMAAANEGTSLPFDELVAFSREPEDVELNLIEGIGGVMAPLDDKHTVLDWIEALDTEVLLVVGSYLGSISHTLSAFDVLARRARKPLAIVVSQSSNEPVSTADTARSLELHCGGIPIAILPRDGAANAAALAALIQRLLKLR